MLSGAGIASIHFSPKVTQASLAKFVRGFPTGTGAKPAQLVEQLKAALEGDPHIHVNEVCFVPADSAIAKSSVAAHITARTLGMDSAAANELFNDPEKLLQLIVAAEGTKGSGGSGSGDGSGTYPGTGSGSGSWGKSGGTGHEGDGAGQVYGSGPGGLGSGVGAGDGSNAGTWNIIGAGDGGGAPLDPNVGGFWLNKDGSSGTSSVPGGGTGSGVPGAVPVTGSAAGTRGAESDGNAGGLSTWNIVGGSAEGTPIDPNAGGFWLDKEDSSGRARSGGSGRSVAGATAAHGVGPGHGDGSGDFGAGSGSGSGNTAGLNSRIWR